MGAEPVRRLAEALDQAVCLTTACSWRRQAGLWGAAAGVDGPAGHGSAGAQFATENLTRDCGRITLYDMKTNTLTIRLDADLDKLLTKAARQSGKNRSEIAREALRRQLRVNQFEALRKRIMPFAEARGYLTDEDVFRDVS